VQPTESLPWRRGAGWAGSGPRLASRAVPKEKRARQKEGRRVRLEAQRKVQRRRQIIRRIVIVVIAAALVTGSVLLITRSSSTTPTTTTTTSTSTTTTTTTLPAAFHRQQVAANAVAVEAGCPAALPSTTNPTTTQSWKTQPKFFLTAGVTYYATVKTTKGTFKFKLNVAGAPSNANNFAFLADHGFYRCTPFWRVIQGFVNQGGDPTGQGAGGPGYSVEQNEYPEKVASGVQYPVGSVAMANSGPHTNGSQFFVVAKNLTAEELPPNYTIIGQVVSGMAVVTAINRQGGTSANNGVPPDVTNRVLSITISTT
jgi:peptidyl-prolyl cis-trans isomerase B (cyclophilin B)